MSLRTKGSSEKHLSRGGESKTRNWSLARKELDRSAQAIKELQDKILSIAVDVSKLKVTFSRRLLLMLKY